MASEQERDRLIEKAEDVIAAAKENFPSGRYKVIAVTAIEALVDAGWRPPPTGDVIEQARKKIGAMLSDAVALEALDSKESEPLFDALVDVFTGLLRAPVEQDETTIEVPLTEWLDHVREKAELRGEVADLRAAGEGQHG